MAEVIKMNFVVEGEFVTNLAREKFYQQHDLEKAIEILRSCLVTDKLTYNQITMLSLQILNYDADIVGRSDSDDYGVVFVDEAKENESNFENIINEIEHIKDENIRLKEENATNLRKFLFLCEETDEIDLERINADYYNEYGEPMFSDMEIPDWRKNENQLVSDSQLNEFIEQRIRQNENPEEADEDYGWLAPDGTYYPVEWGHHSEWAKEYSDEHYPFKENANMYWKKDANGVRRHYVCGDFLIYCLHWVLIDSPYRGKGRPQYDTAFGMTKAQKEFMYDYYIKRGRNKEANELYID